MCIRDSAWPEEPKKELKELTEEKEEIKISTDWIFQINYFIYSMSNSLMEYLTNLWNNQPNILIGGGLATLVLLGIYIKLLDIYQWKLTRMGGV